MPANVQLDHHQMLDLQKAFLETYDDRSSFEQMLFFRTGEKLSRIASDNAGLSEAVFRVLLKAQANNWIPTLVRGAHEHNPAQPSLRQFVATTFPDMLISWGGGGKAVADPLKAHFLRKDRKLAFIGRDGLRDGLDELTKPHNAPRILAVHSDLDRCGKTYSAEFIKFVALHPPQPTNSASSPPPIIERRQHCVAYIDLGEEISLGNGLQELVEQLGTKLRADVSTIPEQEAQTARWIRDLVTWLIDKINRSTYFWWLVLDSINQVKALPQEIHDFVERLARQLEIDEHDPPCRLVLISYQGREQLPVDLRHRVVQDSIDAKLGPDQMHEFFKEQTRGVLGNDADDDRVHVFATTLCDAMKAKLGEYPEETRPFAISQVVRQVLSEFEASDVVEESPQ